MKILLATLFFLVVTLTGCAMLNPQQKENVRTALSQMQHDGQISSAQYDALISALDTGNMSQFWSMLLAMGLTLGGSLLGVRIQRGPVTPLNIKEQQIAEALATKISKKVS